MYENSIFQILLYMSCDKNNFIKFEVDHIIFFVSKLQIIKIKIYNNIYMAYIHI